MRKQFLVLSISLLISIFLPWFSVNILITTMTYEGFKLGSAGILLIGMGGLGIIMSTLKYQRFKALVESLIGAFTLLLAFIANAFFYSKITNAINGIASGFGQQTGNLASGSNIAQSLGNTEFGFYLAIIIGILMLLFGIRDVIALDKDPLFPDKWNVESMFKNGIGQSYAVIRETSATVNTAVKNNSIDFRNITATSKGKWMIGLIGIVVVYLLALVFHNSAQTPTSIIQNIESDVASHNVSGVKNLITSNAPLSSGAYLGFVDYYSKHPNVLSSILENAQSGNGMNQLFTDGIVKMVHQVGFLGFSGYKLQMPSVSMQLKGPSQCAWKINGQPTTMPERVLPAVYSISATVPSVFGAVVETKHENTTNGDIQGKFGFSSNMLTIQTNDMSGSAAIEIKGKSFPVNIQAGNQFAGNGNSAQLGPYPNLNGTAVRLIATLPWGAFVESGTIQNGSVTVQAGPNDNTTLVQTLANVINQFNIASIIDGKTGNYMKGKELPFLVPNGPTYQEITSQNGTQNSTYLRMVASPLLSLTTVGNNAAGINIPDSEYYNSGGSSSEADWIYSMQYNSSENKWQIYQTQSGSHVSSNAPGAVVIHQ